MKKEIEGYLCIGLSGECIIKTLDGGSFNVGQYADCHTCPRKGNRVLDDWLRGLHHKKVRITVEEVEE